MSYGFDLMFKQVSNKLEAYELAHEFANKCYKKGMEYIEDSKYYIPSMRLRCGEKADEYWLYRLFSFSFIYWEKYNLLAVLGQRYPEEARELFDLQVYFQNSTDQDYEFEEWGNCIPLFNELVDKAKNMSVDEIYAIFNTDGKDWYEKEDIEKNLDYYRRSAVYEQIYALLDLNAWLWDNDDFQFSRFSVSALDSTEKHSIAMVWLKKVYYNLQQEEEAWKEKMKNKKDGGADV